MHFTVNVAKKHFNAAVSDTGAAAQPERKIYQQRAAQSIDCIWFTGCVFQSLERSQPFLLAHWQTAIASHSVRLPPPASSSSSLCACELLVWWRCRNLRPETRDQDDVLLNSQCDTDLCTPKLIQFDGLELAEEGGGWCMGRGTLLSQAAGDAHSGALFIQSGSRSGLWGPWLANSALAQPAVKMFYGENENMTLRGGCFRIKTWKSSSSALWLLEWSRPIQSSYWLIAHRLGQNHV